MIVKIQETSEGEQYIELPKELLDSLDWNYDDILVWSVHEDGTITLRKNEDD